MNECRACGGYLRQLHTYETPRATHESVKCRACGRAGVRSIGLAPTVRRFGQCFATRSLNPGGRPAQQPDAATDATSLPPGRTDRGGLVTDGGQEVDDA